MAWSTIYNTKLIISGWKASQLTGRTTSFSTCLPFKKKISSKLENRNKNKKTSIMGFSSSHLATLSGHLKNQGRENSKNQKRKSSANKSPPHKKKRSRSSNLLTTQKPTLLLLTLFLGGIGKNHASQRLLQLTFSRNPTSWWIGSCLPVKPDAQSGAPTKEILNSKKDTEFYAMISITNINNTYGYSNV